MKIQHKDRWGNNHGAKSNSRISLLQKSQGSQKRQTHKSKIIAVKRPEKMQE